MIAIESMRKHSSQTRNGQPYGEFTIIATGKDCDLLTDAFFGGRPNWRDLLPKPSSIDVCVYCGIERNREKAKCAQCGAPY